MTSQTVTYVGGQVFDGDLLHQRKAARFKRGVFDGLLPEAEVRSDGNVVDLRGRILAPGYVDLQVNGGGGIMFNDDPSVETLMRIAEAHRVLGTTAILPTLITDTPRKTQAAIAAARDAFRKGVRGIAGLHLEGPHLSVVRKGAHDAGLIRPMEAADLDHLIAAKDDIPVLKVTIAPENVTRDQVARMSQAGILVSLGHTDADFETCQAYAAAGARCVTHLFNAMSQLGNREPGLVGAALRSDGLSAGLIADGVHVHPSTMQTAWLSKAGSGQIFLVSDAMAVAGTDHSAFYLGGRQISRKGGRLTLADGTLAGADLDLTRAIQVLVNDVGVGLEDALRAATSIPAELINLPRRSAQEGTPLSDFNLIAADLSSVHALRSVSDNLVQPQI